MIDRQPSRGVIKAASAGAVFVMVLAFGPRLGAAGAPDAAAAPDVIVACVGSNGDLRVASGNDGCKRTETVLTWNIQGPNGNAGPTGPTGPTGPAGAEGAAGRDGRDGHDGAGNAPPTVNAQMKIDGLNSNNPTPIFSFSLGATNSISTSGGGAGVGKVTFANLVVSKMLDGDSVPLLQAAATGQILKTLVIDVSAAGSSVPFATYTFEDVVVTSNVLGSSTSAVTEQDAFDFRRITSDVTVNGQAFHSCFDIKAFSSCS